MIFVCVDKITRYDTHPVFTPFHPFVFIGERNNVMIEGFFSHMTITTKFTMLTLYRCLLVTVLEYRDSSSIIQSCMTIPRHFLGLFCLFFFSFLFICCRGILGVFLIGFCWVLFVVVVFCFVFVFCFFLRVIFLGRGDNTLYDFCISSRTVSSFKYFAPLRCRPKALPM